MGQGKSKDASEHKLKQQSQQGRGALSESPDRSRARRLLRAKNSKKWRRKQQGYSLPCGLNEIGVVGQGEDFSLPGESCSPSGTMVAAAAASVRRRSSFQVNDAPSVHLVAYNKKHQFLAKHNNNHIATSLERFPDFYSKTDGDHSPEEEEQVIPSPVLQRAAFSILDACCEESVYPLVKNENEERRRSTAEIRVDPGLPLESPKSLSISQPALAIAPLKQESPRRLFDIKRIKTLEFIRRQSLASGIEEEEENAETSHHNLSTSMPNFDVSTRFNHGAYSTCSTSSSESGAVYQVGETEMEESNTEHHIFSLDGEDSIDYDEVIDQAFNDILNVDDGDQLAPLETEAFQKRLPPLGCSSDENVGEECYDSLDEDGRIRSRRRHSQSTKNKPRRSLPALPKEASNYSSASERALKVLKQKAVPPSSSNSDHEKMTTIHNVHQMDSLISTMKDSLEDIRDPEVVQDTVKSYSPNRDDSGCQSLESNNLFSTTQRPVEEVPGFLWVGLNSAKSFKEGLPNRRVERSKSLSCSRAPNQRYSAPPGSCKDFKLIKEEPSLSAERRTSRRNSCCSSSISNNVRGRSGGGVTASKPLTRSSSSRIHSAVVTGINGNTKSVTVEWRERDETKGKEIELETLLSLNQDLIPQNNGPVISNNKLPKYSTRPSNNNRNSAASSSTSQNTNVVNNSSGMRNRNKFNSRQTMGIPLNNEDSPPASNIPVPNSVASNNIHTTNGHGSENAPPSSSSRIPATQQQQQLNYSTTTTGAPTSNGNSAAESVGKAAASGGVGGVNRRRSNVVKEVERLKKNREERRAKQAEILEEKEAQKNIDPGNPNWEFLSMIRDYQEQLEFNPLQDGDQITDHQITVCVRKRPLNKKEEKRKEVDVVTMPNKDQIIVHEPKTKVDLTKYLDNQHFRFDYAFDDTATNELVYKYAARPLVQNIFEGGMATCFAYGQTGSGKTHTMGGEFHGKSQDSKNGIYALATTDVFKFLKSPKYKSQKLQVSCSYFEIYSGKVFDLLSGKSKLRVLEDGKQQVVIVGLTEKVVECVEDVLKLITHGNNLRTSGQTSANAHSSRSHAVFQIILRQNKNKLFGKFSLIDLAGNERGADTSSADRQTRMEGAEINKSLLALKECIRALGRKGGHLPFRASKLTQVLRDSFIGEKSKTCMIAMVSPVLSSCEHTLNTLRYADRVKELGANDPATCPPPKSTSPTELEPETRMEDGVLSPEDSDLAQLRSLNEGELSADWYNFQEAISHLQILEEELVENHRSTITQMSQWIEEDAALIAVTNGVDYDQDAYCHQLEEMIEEKIQVLSALKEKARNFLECQIDEEVMSRKLFMHKNN